MQSGKARKKVFYGWVIVSALLVINFALGGIFLSFGVFFNSIENVFSLSRALTSAIFSAYSLMACPFSLLGGWALDKYGPRPVVVTMGVVTGLSLFLTSQVSEAWQLFITYSLFLAMGTGAMYVVPVSVVLRWFDRKRGVALGIAGSGSGLGTMVMTPLAAFLIVNTGWRSAYLMMALTACLLIIPAALLLKRDPAEIGALPDGVGPTKVTPRAPAPGNGKRSPANSFLEQTLLSGSFWLFLVVWLLMAFSIMLVSTHITRHAIDLGFQPGPAAFLLCLVGGTEIAGTIIIGFLADSVGKRWAVLICALLQSAATAGLIWARGLPGLYLCAAVFGFAAGGNFPATTALISTKFGTSGIGKVLGALDFGWAVGAALGPFVGGLVFDIYGDYSFAFGLAAVAMIGVAVITGVISRQPEWTGVARKV